MGLSWPSKVSRSYFSKNFLTHHFIHEVQTLRLMFQKGNRWHSTCTVVRRYSDRILLRGTMSTLKDKAKDKVDAAAKAVKKASDKAIDKSKDLTHQAGKAVEKGGKRLQEV
jgi:hypothetical protein